MGGGSFRALKSRWGVAALAAALAGVCAATLAADVGQPQAGDVVSVRLGGDSSETRIVVDLRKSASGAIDGSADPSKLALVLKGVSASGLSHGQGRGVVQGWTMAQGPGGARLTLALTAHAQVQRRFLLPPADGVATYRYVLDIAGPTPRVAKTIPAAPPPPLVAVAAIAPPATYHARKVIVLDPGHGGRDPGAQGVQNWEKNLTLATALAVKDRLEKTGRYQVVMTRTNDVYIPLEQRVQVARRAGADLFLSLHADSGPDPTTHGATVYTLSEKGETRVGYVLGRHEWFQRTAAVDNDRAVGQILLDLTQRSTRNRSAIFAQDLIEHVGDAAPLQPRSQRDANYFVLLAPDVPAALLEMGFITNPGDEARLSDSKERAELADRIAQSIDDYFAASTKLASR